MFDKIRQAVAAFKKEAVMKGFKFKLGEVVGHRANINSRFTILEQVSRECSGGIQLSYCCRMSVPDGVTAPGVSVDSAPYLMEIELRTLTKVEKQVLLDGKRGSF